jgi:hypothetical protein
MAIGDEFGPNELPWSTKPIPSLGYSRKKTFEKEFDIQDFSSTQDVQQKYLAEQEPQTIQGFPTRMRA